MNNPLISASIIAGDYKNLGETIAHVESGGIDLWHIDIMDGHFVPNITFGPDVTKSIHDLASKPLDVHLMVSNLPPVIDAFIALSPKIITIHVELSDQDIIPILDQIQKNHILAGLAINPNTPVDVLQPYFKRIDHILIMTVEPGFAGQAFMPKAAEKIKQLSAIRVQHNLDFTIGVDGGISTENAQSCWQDGADILIAGSSILKQNDYGQAVQNLRPKP
jgi:ribulose-phosphate 3-epimerase